jgi:hypothetical protein
MTAPATRLTGVTNDMKHFAEGQIRQAQKQASNMKIPEDLYRSSFVQFAARVVAAP